MFVQRNSGDECVFFIFSQKLPACQNSKGIAGHVKYDYTYAQKTDSVSMLLTINLSKPFKIGVVDISNKAVSISSVPEIVYIKPSGSKMQYRLRIMMSFDEFCNIYDSTTPFIFNLKLTDIDGAAGASFGYNDKSWVENRKKMLSIIELIKLNIGKQ